MKLEPSSRPRTACLAMPKKLHENYQPPQQVTTNIMRFNYYIITGTDCSI